MMFPIDPLDILSNEDRRSSNLRKCRQYDWRSHMSIILLQGSSVVPHD